MLSGEIYHRSDKSSAGRNLTSPQVIFCGLWWPVGR